MDRLLLPPVIQIVLLCLTLVLWKRYRAVSWALVVMSVSSLYLLSVRPVADKVMNVMETQNPVLDTTMFHHQTLPEAIVVLGGGVEGYAPDYEMAPQPSALLLQRLRYATHVAGKTRLPILVTGGSPKGINEATVMDRVLREDFGIKTDWQEKNSWTTRENGQYSREILEPLGIKRIILVTHALHMPRAKWVFQHEGFDVIAAPTAYLGSLQRYNWRDWLPSLQELQKSQWGLHEMMGLLWYRIRYDV